MKTLILYRVSDLGVCKGISVPVLRVITVSIALESYSLSGLSLSAYTLKTSDLLVYCDKILKYTAPSRVKQQRNNKRYFHMKNMVRNFI